MKNLLLFLTVIVASSVHSQFFGVTQHASTIFRTNDFGTPVSALYQIDTLGGAEVMGGLIEYNGKLYGRTISGGLLGGGYFFEFDIANESFTELLQLDSSIYYCLFNAPMTLVGNKIYGSTYLNGQNSKLFEYDIPNNSIQVVASFPGKYAYYELMVQGGFGYFSANGKQNPQQEVVYKIDLSTHQITDSIVFDPLLHGSGSTQLVKLNQDTLLAINNRDGWNDFGVISAIDLTNFSLDSLYSFVSDGSVFSQANVINEQLYMLRYSGDNTTLYVASFQNGSYTILDSTPVSSLSSDFRPNKPILIGNNIVFQMANVSYAYSLTTSTLNVLAAIDELTFGSGYYFNALVHYSGLNTVENETLTIPLYPNPSEDAITLMLSEQTTLLVVDQSGKKVLTQHVLAGKQVVSISNLPQGVYTIFQENGKSIGTFVKR